MPAPVPVTTTESTAAVTLSVKSRSVTVKVPLSLKPALVSVNRRSVRSTGDDGRVVRTVDRDHHGFGYRLHTLAVFDLDRVSKCQRLAAAK